MARKQDFQTIRIEGGLLPSGFLRSLSASDPSLPGISPASYHEDGRITDAVGRAWNELRGRWEGLQGALDILKEGDAATGATLDKFLLPLFNALGYGRLPRTPARMVGEEEFPISRFWGEVPIHLVGWNVPLDKRSPGVPGAARMSPHSLVQLYLNEHEASLWAFLCNGQKLRILRDSKAIARPSYIEFDLVTMFEQEVYSDFTLLWLLCHQSRVEAEDPYKCYLEKWARLADETGTRALEKLRVGVAEAIRELGQGFMENPANGAMRDALAADHGSADEFYRQLLRVVYRLIFLFVAEDRDLLFPEDADARARETYTRFYSATRLRNLCRKRHGGNHSDLWEGLAFVFSKLSVEGCEKLAIPALNSFLWNPKATSFINGARITNKRLLAAIRSLGFIDVDGSLRRIDYRNLDSEELGGIYENIIALSPTIDAGANEFTLDIGKFSERDKTASHYTPACLVDELLDSALDPVLDRACKLKDPEEALLNLKICDRACGSGHFLLGAARRIGKRIAMVRTGEAEPSPRDLQEAIRDVISHCIYGVDLNPTAVELCKVSLWMESMEPGKPLSFLESRIRVGNSLLGATPAAIRNGVPDKAFEAIRGDEKNVCTALKKRNKQERKDAEDGQEMLFSGEILWTGWARLHEGAVTLVEMDEGDIDSIRMKQEEFDSLMESEDYLNQKLVADAWCAAFVLPKLKSAPAITYQTFEEIKADPSSCPDELRAEIKAIADQYGFYHWHIEFPEVYDVTDLDVPDNELYGWSGGFDVSLGNPPWNRIKIQEKKWFAERDPEIAKAPNAAARKRLIDSLKSARPELHEQFQQALRMAEGQSHILRDSGMFPLCARGDINLYAVFTEANRRHLNRDGLMGVLIPSGIATDDTTKDFFRALIANRSLVSLFDFQSGPGLFGEVGHARFKFCLLTVAGGSALDSDPEFAFFLRDVAHLRDAERRFTLSTEDVALLILLC